MYASSPEKRLVLFSGLPGTGKTTLARRLAAEICAPLFAKDRVQSTLRKRGLSERGTADGYFLILSLADEQLSLGVSAVLDAVFPMEGFRSAAREIAGRYAASFYPIWCTCSDETLWQQRMLHRHPYVPDWTPVGWEDVKRLETAFEPWATGTAVSIDAAEDINVNYQKIRDWIKTS